jgi:hypothetical protein
MTAQDPQAIQTTAPKCKESQFARMGMALADWSQRWFPDAFVFALSAIAIVFVAGLLLGSSPPELSRYFGEGFWSLLPFTMQMAMIIIGGLNVLLQTAMQDPLDSRRRLLWQRCPVGLALQNGRERVAESFASKHLAARQ